MTPERDLISLEDLTFFDIEALVERAEALAIAGRDLPQSLSGTRAALIVNDGGWRNISAFELGIVGMGGQCVRVPLVLGAREATEDIGAYLDNWFDILIARAPDLTLLQDLATAAKAPVINARTRQNHPCETLGDLAFYWHRHHQLAGIKVVVVAPEANILGSWIELSRVAPINVVQLYPEAWHAAHSAGGRFRASTDMAELKDADIIVTDCWPTDAGDAVLPYQITGTVLNSLGGNVEFIPCPPVARGREVSADAMMHPRCRVTEAKTFLLHVQNAVLEWSLGKPAFS
ncbi:ornithine carbamoyltransferase [Martelella sp. FOR1707]